MGEAGPGALRRLALLALAAWVGVPTAAARADEPPSDARLWAHVAVRAEALREGRVDDAEVALELLEEDNRALGGRNAILPAGWLLREAERARLDGDLATAFERVRRALRLAPDLTEAHWARMGLAWEEDPARIARLVPMLVDLGRAWSRGFRNQVDLVLMGALVGMAGLAWAAAFLALSHCVRHLRYQAHDLAERLPRFVGTGEVAAVILALVLLPLAIGPGWAGSVLLGLTLSFGYQSRTERALSVLVVALILSSPWLVSAAAPLVGFNGSRVDLCAQVVEESLSDDAVRALVRMTQGPDDLRDRVLALDATRRGDVEEARVRLQSVLRMSPHDAAVANDLAVSEYVVGNRERAEALFHRAAAEGPELVEPFLNLSLIAGDRGDLEALERARSRARKLDPNAVEGLDAKAGLPTDRRLQRVGLRTGRLWRALIDEEQASFAATRSQLVDASVGRGGLLALAPWAMVGLALGQLGRRRRDRSIPCVRCGAPAKARSSTRHCTQCESVFILSGAIPPATRLAKERQVRRHRFQRRWFPRVMALVPGFGALLTGRSVQGLLQLLLGGVALAWTLTAGWGGLHAWEMAWVTTDQVVQLRLGAMMLGGCVLASVYSTARGT